MSRSNLDSYLGIPTKLLMIELVELDRRRKEVLQALANSATNESMFTKEQSNNKKG